MAATFLSDVTTLRAALLDAEAEAALAKAINADLAARVALLELQNEKIRRALYVQPTGAAFDPRFLLGSDSPRANEDVALLAKRLSDPL